MNDEVMQLPQPERVPQAVISEVPHTTRRISTLPVAIRTALALLLCAGVAVVRLSAPDTAQKLSRWIVGSDGEQLQQAFISMDRAMDEGEGLGEAWTVFCRELGDETA